MGQLAAIQDAELIGLIVLVIGSLVTLLAGRLWWPWRGQRRGSKGDDD